MSAAGQDDLWVFAYGSLMWRPGFTFEERRHAVLTGYRRCFCLYSVHHRGTSKRLGMVLGLDRGGACEGIAYRIAAADAPEVRSYLRAREIVNGVYREAMLPIELDGDADKQVSALAFIVERAHPNYAARLPLAKQARLIRGARGLSGANVDYLVSTLRHLHELKIRERELERLMVMVGPLAWARSRAQAVSPYAAALAQAERIRPTPVRRRARKDEMRKFLYRMRLGARTTVN
jgi:cation transport protein ChaC